MQLVVDIQDKRLADKIIRLLSVFKSDGVSIRTIENNTDVQKELPEFDVDYENSIQYKMDRAEFEEMKENL